MRGRLLRLDGFSAGPPQGKMRPLGGQRPAKRWSVGALVPGPAAVVAPVVVALGVAPVGVDITTLTAAVTSMTPAQGPHHAAAQGERKPCECGNLQNTSDGFHETLLGGHGGRTVGQRAVGL